MGRNTSMNRRSLVKWGLLSTGLSLMPRGNASSAFAQVGGRSEEDLFQGKGLPGGAQLDDRLTQSYFTSDPDEFEVAARMKPFNPDSWYVEWKRVAEKNEQLAEGFEQQGLKVTAVQYYDRAASFYARATTFLPESDSRMLPGYNKTVEIVRKSWSLIKPNVEVIEIPWEGGKTLTAFFRKPSGPPGTKFPTVFAHGGADGVSGWSGARSGGSEFTARGMAHISVEGPGQSGSLRTKGLHQPPDAERFAKAVFDYLVSRPDVDPNRLGITGGSMGGYGAPRSASGEHRIKACAFSSGSYSLREDIFDYFPPIQERLRWIIGATDLVDARKKMAEFTLEGRADKIECPMLVGYSKDDRVMDPQGAFRLYQAAVNSKRIMVEGIGHNHPTRVGGPNPRRPPVIPDWMMKQLVG